MKHIENERNTPMKAVITVTGKDKVGITAMASAECAKYGVNIVDISQTVLDEYFAMIMLVELSGLTVDFTAFADSMKAEGGRCGVDIRVMHEDIFNTMHKI
jgi:ACT domain-containing protein